MVFRFGAFELDEKLFELRRSGEIVALQRRAFDLLHHLVKRHEVVVSKKELLESIWCGVAVTKDALPRAMMSVREALGDDVDEPTFIQTVRGRGYRFMAPVETETNDAAPIHDPKTPPLVGRASSLSLLRERLERATHGRGGIVLVTGEGGMGKTRLLDAICGESAPLRPIAVRCASGEGAPELRPFAQCLAELGRRGLRVDEGLEALTTGSVPSAEIESPDKRFRFLDRIVSALVTFAERSPVLLFVDDLQFADAASLQVLELLAPKLRALPILVVCAYRASPRLRLTLARDPSCTVLTLEPLTRSDVAFYLEHVVGTTPTDAVLERVFEKTRGNPLLVSELVSVLRAAERARGDEMTTGALVGGDRMREAIGHELAALSEATIRVLTYAAVFGRTFGLAPLAAALGVANADALRELDIAEASRMVMRTGSAGAYRFTYPLVCDVLHRHLSVSDHARIHALAARALEDYVGGEGDHADAGEIARHWVEAAPTGEVDKAIDWSLRAARLAEDAGDCAAASRYAELGLGALRFAQKPDADKRASLVAACKRARA